MAAAAVVAVVTTMAMPAVVQVATMVRKPLQIIAIFMDQVAVALSRRVVLLVGVMVVAVVVPLAQWELVELGVQDIQVVTAVAAVAAMVTMAAAVAAAVDLIIFVVPAVVEVRDIYPPLCLLAQAQLREVGRQLTLMEA